MSTVDIDDQGTFTSGPIATVNTSNNYRYDEIGNLTGDEAEEIADIEWTVSGKIKSITRTSLSNLPDLEFRYDTQGNRISKIVKPAGTANNPEEWIETLYVRDATSNIMAIYERKAVSSSMEFRLKEKPIYGSSRIGVKTSNLDMTLTPSTSEFNRLLGLKQYEGVNHLGNVLTTFTDKKIPRSADGTTIAYFMADVVSATDYYPFGMLMPGRSFSSEEYRFGIGGHEKDDDVKGFGNHLSFGDYGYDSRLGKRWRLDPVPQIFISDYAAFGNNPISNVDPDGKYFFGLFGSTSVQRKAASEFAQKTGGTLINKHTSEILVAQTKQVGFGHLPFFVTEHQYFNKDGSLVPQEGEIKQYEPNAAETFRTNYLDYSDTDGLGATTAKFAGNILYGAANDFVKYGSNLIGMEPRDIEGNGINSTELTHAGVSTILNIFTPAEKSIKSLGDEATKVFNYSTYVGKRLSGAEKDLSKEVKTEFLLQHNRSASNLMKQSKQVKMAGSVVGTGADIKDEKDN